MDVTITGIEVVNSKVTGSAAVLRFYYSETITVDGQTVVGGLAGSPTFYTTANCTVEGTTITAESVVLKSTTDSSRPSARVTVQLYDSANRTKLADLYSNWQIPTSLGATVSVQALVAYNAGRPRPLADAYPTTVQVAQMIAGQIGAGSPATPTALGRVKTRTAPTDPANPVAIIEGDPLLAGTGELNVSNYASFSAAVAAIGSTRATLVVSTALTVSANTTVPSTLTLRFVGAGQLSVNSGVTLTINGSIIAESRRIFLGAGSVALPTNNYACEINPVWFSAGSGTFADPWTEWETRITWSERTAYRFPSGFFSYTVSPIFARHGIRLFGSAGTVLLYDGNHVAFNFIAPAQFTRATDVIARDFIIHATSASATHGLYLDSIVQSTFKNIRVRNLAGVAFTVRSSHLNTLETLTTHDPVDDSLIGSGYPAVTRVPTVGIHFMAGGFFQTNNAITVINPDISFCSDVGVKVECLISSVFLGGAVELCGQEGFTFGGSPATNVSNVSVVGTEIEINSGAGSDVTVSVSRGVTFRDVQSFDGTFHVLADAVNTTFDGGTYNSIEIHAGAKATSLRNVAYNYNGSGTFSDLGYGTTYESVTDRVSGVQYGVALRNLTPLSNAASSTVQPTMLTRGVFVFGSTGSGAALSNDPLTASAKWKLIFRGVFYDTVNGSTAVQNAPYLEVTSERNSVSFANGVVLTFTQEVGGNRLIRGVASGASAIAFSGTVEQIPNSDGQIGGDSIDVKGNIKTEAGFFELGEITAPSAPSANRARLYVEDNGSGKSRLMVRFPSGAAQVLATEP